MNKNLFLIAAALALALPWAGCGKSDKLNKPSAFATPSGPVELKLKWPPGERIVQDMDMKQSMELTVPGQPAPIQEDMTLGQGFGMTVLKENPDGGHEVEMEFLSARMGMTSGGATVLDYDSAKKPPADKANSVADMFGKIVGSKIRFFLNASSGVERMEGVEELVNRLSSGGPADQFATLKSMFSESYFKELMSHYRILPPKPAQPGDTWPVQYEVPMANMGILVMNYNVTLKGWETHEQRNCARLEFQGTLKAKPDPAAKPADMSVSNLEGTTSGVSWFDPELGMTIGASMTQDMTMVMKIPMNPNGTAGAAGETQSITNQMRQDMTVKLVSVK
ncbi:MAG: DUF6263 family protein [Verrucomicrobiota bacterium]|jgi:hypothetical protein